jgi:hypothetical protein
MALILSHPPARAALVKSRCPGCRRRRSFRTRPFNVVAVTGAVNALTGAVTAVTWVRDPALDVTGTVPAVIAVAGRCSLSRRADGPGHLPLATLRSLAHETLACVTKVATALRDTCRHARTSRYPLHRCRSRRWS